MNKKETLGEWLLWHGREKMKTIKQVDKYEDKNLFVKDIYQIVF